MLSLPTKTQGRRSLASGRDGISIFSWTWNRNRNPLAKPQSSKTDMQGLRSQADKQMATATGNIKTHTPVTGNKHLFWHQAVVLLWSSRWDYQQGLTVQVSSEDLLISAGYLDVILKTIGNARSVISYLRHQMAQRSYFLYHNLLYLCAIWWPF